MSQSQGGHGHQPQGREELLAHERVEEVDAGLLNPQSESLSVDFYSELHAEDHLA